MLRDLEIVETYLSRVSGIRWTDIVEMIILSFLLYQILVWIKNTRAWSLLKGILVIAVFILIAAQFEMTTILWIVENMFGVAVTAVIVILQPELRKAVEELGRKILLRPLILLNWAKIREKGVFRTGRSMRSQRHAWRWAR